MNKVVLVAFATLLIVPLSGCISEDDTPLGDDTLDDVKECASTETCGQAVLGEDGRDLRTELVANDSLDAPEWNVGDVFEQHVYYGSDDTGGTHIKTMIVEDRGDCRMIATDDAEAAKFESTFDLPILGCVGKDGLDVTAFGEDWSWMYDFPLEDGKSWDGEFQELFNWNTNGFIQAEFTLTASYAEAVDTPFGDYPGFQIDGVTSDGETLLSYNYVPAVGWFSHFWIWDITTPEEDDVVFHAMSMGNSKGYEGVYYIDETTFEHQTFSMPPAAAFAVFDQGNPVDHMGDEPVQTFDVPEETMFLTGVIAPIACLGESRVTLEDPSGGSTEYVHTFEGEAEDCQSEGPNPAMYTPHFLDLDAQPGEWRTTTAGYGFWGSFIWIQGILEVEYTLEASEDPETADI